MSVRRVWRIATLMALAVLLLAGAHAVRAEGTGNGDGEVEKTVDEVEKYAKPAKSTLLKAPVHTCVIKFYQGLKKFVREAVKSYPSDTVTVNAYSQPPHFVFFDEDNDLLGRVYVEKSWTEDDIIRMLNEKGIVRPGDDELFQPGFPNAGSCEDDEL